MNRRRDKKAFITFGGKTSKRLSGLFGTSTGSSNELGFLNTVNTKRTLSEPSPVSLRRSESSLKPDASTSVVSPVSIGPSEISSNVPVEVKTHVAKGDVTNGNVTVTDSEESLANTPKMTRVPVPPVTEEPEEEPEVQHSPSKGLDSTDLETIDQIDVVIASVKVEDVATDAPSLNSVAEAKESQSTDLEKGTSSPPMGAAIALESAPAPAHSLVPTQNELDGTQANRLNSAAELPIAQQSDVSEAKEELLAKTAPVVASRSTPLEAAKSQLIVKEEVSKETEEEKSSKMTPTKPEITNAKEPALENGPMAVPNVRGTNLFSGTNHTHQEI